MVKIAPQLDPKVYILKSYHSKDKIYPYLKVTINEDDLTLDCHARIRTLRVGCKQAVSLSQPAVILSQPLCTYHNKRITYVVHS